MEGLVLNCVDVPVGIKGMKILQDMEVLQDLEANTTHSIL